MKRHVKIEPYWGPVGGWGSARAVSEIFLREGRALKELHLPVRGINVGEAAGSRENCSRLRDELWFKGREWFQDRACSMPQDEALIAELTAPTYALHLDW